MAKVERTEVEEKIAALRTELHELFKLIQEGRETETDVRRVDDLGHQIHELQLPHGEGK